MGEIVMKRLSVFLVMTVLLSANLALAGVTGKIAGVVIDAETNLPLPGVNIVVKGTTMGAATDFAGKYVILNVPPGTYTLTATMIGYAAMNKTDVRVFIDQTTTVDFPMKSEVLMGEIVTVVAERPVVEKDVAASKKNISTDQIAALPVTSVNEVMGLQAGITKDLSIRGSGSTQAVFMVDGVVLRDERDSQPMTAVPLSAVQEISVQTGGFNAEYQNVRSGVVNVVTKEGSSDRYSGTITYKYHPPSPKYFGMSPYDPNFYWLRPYLDPAVCWTGTKNGNWDLYTQRQYPEFSGWNAVAERTLQDDDPTNDLTPDAAQRIFLYEHRKQGDIKDPDYNIDGGFGGPVPFIGKALGNLRFYTSFRQDQNMYMIELSRKALTNKNWMMKLNSDLRPDMKLSILGLYGETYAVSSSFSGGTSYMQTPKDIAEQMITGSFTTPTRIYTNIYWSPTSQFYNTLSAKFTHTLSPNTFYEVQMKRIAKKYHTGPGRYRDLTKKYEVFPGYFEDERPYGFSEQPIFGMDGIFIMGGPISVSRDSSKLATWTARVDLVSQVDSKNQIKTGIEFVYDQFDMSFGQINKYLPEGNTWTTIKQNPYRGSFYVQDKIEVGGFISSLGLIMEYSNPNGKWYDVTPYERGYFSNKFEPEDEALYKTKSVKGRFTVSPRLAISHPITVNSKLYFNYGHYRQMPTSERYYRNQRALTGQIDYFGDPTIPLAKTVSYELGYDHAILRDYLFHLSAYYKDITDQESWVRYISFDGKVNYYKLTNNSYEDIRGFEVDLYKSTGRWFYGDINYEYRVGTSGYFGVMQNYENPADQRDYLRKNPQQSKPRPRPRFKAYLDFHTPTDFGGEYMGLRPFSDWHLLVLGTWTGGLWDTWNPNSVPGIQYNVRWTSTSNVDLKLSKSFLFDRFEVKLFMDIYNVFNLKHFSRLSFVNVYDRNYYMQSLHLPAKIADRLGYGNIPGNDRPGDYRKTGVEYQPMEWVADYTQLRDPNPRVIYYDAATKTYVQYQDNGWQEVEKKRLNKILEDKAYIDMPNQTSFTFLNPRSVFFGINVNFNF